MKTALNIITGIFLALAISCGDNAQEEKQKETVAHQVSTDPRSKVPVTLTVAEFEGMKLFMRNCNKCHPGGEEGIGPALNDKALPNFLIHFQVRTGRGDMPKFTKEQISKEQLEQITAFVKMMQVLTKETQS